MDKFDKAVNICMAVTFGTAGIVALIGAVFFGATHQFAIALIGAVAATLLIAEVRREEKRSAWRKFILLRKLWRMRHNRIKRWMEYCEQIRSLAKAKHSK